MRIAWSLLLHTDRHTRCCHRILLSLDIERPSRPGIGCSQCLAVVWTPSLDMINRCIRCITLGLTQYIIDLEKIPFASGVRGANRKIASQLRHLIHSDTTLSCKAKESFLHCRPLGEY
ncbi:hypothetical protein VP01_1391g1 [Puccinia sorghi]|uniref:Uncharacterized protein n=1 Tax=Puccinia sorghi TaxID=27349 RepID=A0A0L6VL55_9BASI|nr:hypothetical protein VP01_1391g1 [Puccinia sorghi]